MRQKKTTYLIFILAFLNIIIVCVWGYLFWTISQKKEAIFGLARETALVNRELEDLRLAKILLKSIEESKKEIDSAFLNKENLVLLIESLEQKADDLGLALRMSSISVDEKKNRVSFKFNVSGAFKNIYTYLLFLENMPYQLDFDKVYIQKGENGWIGNFNLTLVSYENN